MKKLLNIFLVLCALSFGHFAFAVSDDINVRLNVTNDGSGGGGGGGFIQLTIDNVNAVTSTSTALVTWTTNLQAYSILSFGKTTSYELGTIAEVVSKTNHSVTIHGLEPGMSYFFKIEACQDGDPANCATSLLHIFVTATATTDEPPPSPLPFDATYTSAISGISLTWKNPSVSDFDVVRLVRSSTFFPLDPNDGLIIYEGTEESFDDALLNPGIYYYSLFARDKAGNWSAPAVDSDVVPTIIQVTPPPPPPPPPDFPIDEGTTTIFDHLPEATSTPPELENLSFTFLQKGETQIFKNGSRIKLSSDEPTTIYISYENLPEVLKTIVVTLHHPKDPSKVFSFILRVDESKSRYTATIGPLLDAGEYTANIYVLDHTYSRLVKLTGKIVVTKPRGSQIVPAGGTLLTIGGTLGLFAGALQVLFVTTQITSFYDLYLLILRFGGVLLGIFGFRRRHKPWGTVYDSVTKRPLDPAYVVVRDASGRSKSVADAITDLDGRYGFFLPSGNYVLEAGKTHYNFPSTMLANKRSDELYDNLYHGEVLTTAGGEVITRNIPLDPIDFDWNEFVKNKQTLFRLYSRKEKVKTFVLDILYLFGFVFTLIATLISPNLFNFIILGSYVVVFLLQTYWRAVWKAITVKDENNEPYSYAIVRVFLSNLNQEVKRVVTDQFGRFYLLVAPGNYYVTVDAKMPDSSYRRVYRSGQMHLSRGILGGDIIISDSQISLKPA